MAEFFNLDISLIDEDPEQPRRDGNAGFSEKSLNELAETIRERGVKSPISVRESGNGRYIINHGARRYRASIIAGKSTIPAFIDNDYTKLDQVIENIQRENLTPREIADYIGYRVSHGAKKGELAKELGKSNAWISQHFSLLDLPEPIAKAMNAGKISDLTAIAELVKVYNKSPEDVSSFINESGELSRSDVQTIKEYVEQASLSRDKTEGDDIQEASGTFTEPKKKPGPIGPKPKIIVMYHDNRCELRLVRPQQQGNAVIYCNGDSIEVPINELQLENIE
jgi:ParB family chromosome partitioning protein